MDKCNCGNFILDKKEKTDGICYNCISLKKEGYTVKSDCSLENKHGVTGYFMGNSPCVFVPIVCQSCDLLDSDCWNDGHNSSYWCMDNLMFPTRKGNCKRNKN